MGFGSALTYDMETWSAAQQRWLEVSSVSNFETFQSNRLKLRFRNAEGKTQLAHTLNGSALALSALDDLPRITGAPTPAGALSFAPATITFLAVPTAANNACR